VHRDCSTPAPEPRPEIDVFCPHHFTLINSLHTRSVSTQIVKSSRTTAAFPRHTTARIERGEVAYYPRYCVSRVPEAQTTKTLCWVQSPPLTVHQSSSTTRDSQHQPPKSLHRISPDKLGVYRERYMLPGLVRTIRRRRPVCQKPRFSYDGDDGDLDFGAHSLTAQSPHFWRC
jgi:hypothetical protein